MPKWIYGAYSLILLTGASATLMLLFGGYEIGAAASLFGTSAAGFGVFLFSVRQVSVTQVSPQRSSSQPSASTQQGY